ncbi:MAG TPA: hypothetical protein QGF95_19105 [Candidatus Latescibacteria bacterium]|nr:hypothetical protein [Candidatus Latescibacterota bacterium]HJP32659.1 hypothetical protein [Candidatus Latescibacterota bacterium]
MITHPPRDFSTRAPVAVRSSTLRVTTVIECTRAVAPMRPSAMLTATPLLAASSDSVLHCRATTAEMPRPFDYTV